MKNPFKHVLEQQWEPVAAAAPAAKLEINVIFTDRDATRAALKAAASLAGDLDASVRLLAIQAVPVNYPINHPPIAIPFTMERLSALVSEEVEPPVERTAHLYLCRDKLQALLKVLKVNSLVVMGVRSRWWLSADNSLLRKLRSKGHQAISVRVRRGSVVEVK